MMKSVIMTKVVMELPHLLETKMVVTMVAARARETTLKPAW